MADSMPMGPTASIVPGRLRTAIADLWQLPRTSNERIHLSRSFRVLEDTCRSVYAGIEGSRLMRQPSIKLTPSVLNRTLQNFFRWNGAPWLTGRTPSADETASSLHGAFLRQTIYRTYLVPLDRLYLEDRSSGSAHEVTSVRFGPNEIVRLHREELAQRIPADGLARFGARFQFPTAELDGFFWLATGRTEPAGPIEKRTWLDLFNTRVADVDTVGLFRSIYPTPVEDALFALLLILLKDPGETPWQPFQVPWIFSFTNDLFSGPVPPPDPSALSHDIVGDEHDQFEVPDKSEVFAFGTHQQEALQRRWKHLETVLARGDTDDANFHPLTKHFFVKALSEHGVDEIISNVSCLEATLMLKADRNRTSLKQRFAHLVDDHQASQWLKSAYRLRDDYLHSLADPKHMVTRVDLARTRWNVAMAVGRYLDFAIQRPELNRSQLLKQLHS